MSEPTQEQLAEWRRVTEAATQKPSEVMAGWNPTFSRMALEAMPALLDEVSRLRQELDRNRQCYRELADVTDQLRARCIQAEQVRHTAGDTGQ